jgi:hypothetical protein
VGSRKIHPIFRKENFHGPEQNHLICKKIELCGQGKTIQFSEKKTVIGPEQNPGLGPRNLDYLGPQNGTRLSA